MIGGGMHMRVGMRTTRSIESALSFQMLLCSFFFFFFWRKDDAMMLPSLLSSASCILQPLWNVEGGHV